MEKLERLSTAPDFSLFDQSGNNFVLTDEHGQWVVLFFCPDLNQSYTTSLSIVMRNRFTEFEDRGVRLIGVYAAAFGVLEQFANEHTLPFSALADEKNHVAERYGVRHAGGIFGPLLGGNAFRAHTFVINPEGKIERIYTKINPMHHVGDLLADLDTLIKK